MSGWGAWVRGDLDLCLVRSSPDYHYDAPREWLIAGVPSVYRGHARLREWFAELREAWRKRQAVEPGSIAFVTKLAEHRFVDIVEDLELLVIFAPPETNLSVP